jgi:DNA-binding protein YbaB
MSSPLADQVEQAMARLKDHRARMDEVRAELRQATASVTSKDRMVTAKAGPQGQIVSLTFHTTAYRTMAPAQLADVLTEVLNEARARVGEQVTEAMRSVSGIGEVLKLSMTGGTELDGLLAPLRSLRPTEEEPGETAKKQDEFNG